MIISKKYISLLLVSGLMFSCQDDETLNLRDFPGNQPSFTIDGSENASNVSLEAVYLQDRTLQVNGEIRRTYTFAIQPSPEDALVTFTPICTNIPVEKVDLSATEVVIPAGSAEATVTVGLKEDDFNFAAATLPETVYELGVIANVAGYKFEQTTYEAKVAIKKEAFMIVASFVGENNNSASFERTVEGNNILNSAPISYKFKVKFDKPSDYDVKVALSYDGIPEAYQKDITVEPSEIVIPAGQLESKEITWSMKDDFVLSTEDPAVFAFKLTPTLETEEKNIKVSEEKGCITLSTSKSVKNIGYEKELDSSWQVLDRNGWEVTDMKNFGYSDNGASILDDNDYSSIRLGYNNVPGEFIVDMKSEKTLKGFELKYDAWYNNVYATKSISIATSSDMESWVKHGEEAGLPNEKFHYIHFNKPVKARYVKVSLFGYHQYWCKLVSIKMFE